MDWNVVMDNLGFVLGCIVVIAALGFGAKFAITTAMAEIFSKDTSTQGFLAGSVGALPPDTEITVTDNHGNVILSCSTKYSTALVILSCPEIAKGESYTLTVGEQTQTVTAS